MKKVFHASCGLIGTTRLYTLPSAVCPCSALSILHFWLRHWLTALSHCPVLHSSRVIPAQRLWICTRFWVRSQDSRSMGLLRSDQCQNDPFPGLYESFSTQTTLTVHKDCQSMATIDLHTTNGRVLYELASCCICANNCTIFLIWRLTSKSSNRQIKTVANMAGQLARLCVHGSGKFTLRLQDPTYYLLRERSRSVEKHLPLHRRCTELNAYRLLNMRSWPPV